MRNLIFLSLLTLLFCITKAQVIDISVAKTMFFGSIVTISGIATNGAELGTIRYIQDSTGGVAVYDNNLSGVQRGDLIEVTGVLTEYNGLIEIANVNSGSITIVSTGNTVPTPNVQPVGTGFSETYEGQLMKFNTVRFIEQGIFAGQTNYNFISGSDSGEVRIDGFTNLVNTPIPTGEVDIIGLMGQYLSTYQIIPRDLNDIVYLRNLTSPIAGNKTAVIELFTGTSSPACPSGHAEVATILSNHSGHEVIAISVSPSNSTLTGPHIAGDPDLRRSFLDDFYTNPYYNGTGNSAMPTAHVQRRKWTGTANSGERRLGMSEISAKVDEILLETSSINVGCESFYSISNQTLSVEAEIRFTSDVTTTIGINVWIIESGILAGQAGDSDPNYIHYHVFRESLTSQWGDAVTGSTTSGSVFNSSFTFDLSTAVDVIDIANADVVVTVYDQTAGEILSGVKVEADGGTTFQSQIIIVNIIGNPICAGSSGQMNVSATGGFPPYNYQWTPAFGLSNPNIPNPTVTIDSPILYTLTVTDSAGFIGDSFYLQQVIIPNVTVIGGSQCTNSIILEASSGFIGYQWNTGETTQQISVSQSGTYSVVGISASGCVAASDPFPVAIIPPIQATVTVNGSYLFTNTADTYQWYYNNVALQNANQQTYHAFVSGNYYVELTDSNGCVVQSNPVFVNVNNPAQCDTLDNLSTTNITGYSAMLNWTIYPNAVSKEIQWREQGSTNWNTAVSSGGNESDYLLQNLQPNTNYEWRIRSVCDPIGLLTSTYSAIQTFTTTYACGVATNLNVEPITPNSARLNWSNGVNHHHSAIRGRRAGTTNWANLPIPPGAPAYKDVFGLSNNITYEWQIITYCDAAETLFSPWSPLNTFTARCYPPDSMWAAPVTTGGARLNWTATPGAAGFEIKGRRIGGGLATITVGSIATTKDVFGLLPGTTYEWTIRALCNLTGTLPSTFTPMDTFVTLPFARLASTDLNKKEEQNLTIYPNPFSNQVFIEYTTLLSQHYAIRIMDAKGVVVFERSQITDTKTIFDRKGLSAGVYFVEVIDEGVLRRKLVVQ